MKQFSGDEPFLFIPNNDQDHLWWNNLCGLKRFENLLKLAPALDTEYLEVNKQHKYDYHTGLMMYEVIGWHNGNSWFEGYICPISQITAQTEDKVKKYLLNECPYGNSWTNSVRRKLQSEHKNLDAYSLVDFAAMVKSCGNLTLDNLFAL